MQFSIIIISILCGIGGIVIPVFIYQIFSKKKKSWWICLGRVSNIAIAVAAISGIIYGIQTIQLEKERRKQEILMQVSQKLNSSEFSNVLKNVQHKTTITIQDLYGNDVPRVCNFFDEIGMYEKFGWVTVADIHECLSTFPCQYWDYYKDTIESFRKIEGTPGAWINFESLCVKLKEFEIRSE